MAEAQDPELKAVFITLGEIMDYIGGSMRPLREGQRVFSSGHIVCLGYTKQQGTILEILAYVLQSSHPGDIPHEIILKIGSNYRQWTLNCTCKAGTARCKHIVACLLHLSHFGFAEYITCTDSRQAWGVSKAEKTNLWGAKPLSQLCCVRKHASLPECNNSKRVQILEEAFARILEASPGSSVNRHTEGRELSMPKPEISPADRLEANCSVSIFLTRSQLKQLFTENQHTHILESFDCLNERQKEFYKQHVFKDINSIIDICDDTKNQSNNAWKLHRSVRITASTSYDLYTYSFNASPDWAKKVQKYLSPKTTMTKAMKYGKLTEDLAFNCYRLKRNPLIKKCGFAVSLSNPWIGASPDGVDAAAKLILEIKCPIAGESLNLDQILGNCRATKNYIRNQGSIYSLNRKHKYFAQVQLNMYVLNCNSCDFIVYSKFEDDFILIEIEYDAEYTIQLLNRLKNIYFNQVLGHIVGKANGNEPTNNNGNTMIDSDY